MMAGKAVMFPCPGTRKPEVNSNGVSEIIGAILLISVTVAAIAIIAVVLFSQTTPEKVPNVNFMIGIDNKLPPTLYLSHNGGDTLPYGSFDVFVDGTQKEYSVSGGGDWSLGKNLLVPLAPGQTPQSIVLVYNQTGKESAVIGSVSANVSVPSVNVVPERIFQQSENPASCINGSDPQQVLNLVLNNVSVIGDAINQSPSTVGPVIANAAGANSITFFKDNRVNLDYTGTRYLRLLITAPGSSIVATDWHPTNPVTLDTGDIVTITMRSNTGQVKVFGLGNQMWEVSASGVDVNITKSGVPDSRSNGDVVHTWITGYSDLGSTLSVSTDNPYTSNTILVVNGTQRINGQNSENIVVTNIRPVGIGLFVLEADNNNHIVYFVGNAQSVTRGGVPVV